VVAISTLLLVVVISLLITRVATVVLTATGMSRESARFQARSAFTGSGFTTRESETVVDHPLRRKVIATLMLLGNAGIVAAVSSTILGFNPHDVGHNWWRVLELVLGLLVLVTVSRSRWVDRRLTEAISHLLRRYTQLPTRDIAGLLDLSGDYSVSELMVSDGDWIAGRSLGELGLRDEGVVVLGLTRKDGRYLAAPTGHTGVVPGDILVVYGRSELLNELDDRPAGRVGDVAHEAAILRQERIERQQDVDEAQPYPSSSEPVRVER
jgi:Trk K+ transport system NAD-binding subunit